MRRNSDDGGGSGLDAAYWREYRAKHKDRLNAQQRARRSVSRVRGDRSKEYAERARVFIDTTPLPVLFPHLRHGGAISFWDEELNMDVEQERELAKLEGRDPDEAANAYRARETTWFMHLGSDFGK